MTTPVLSVRPETRFKELVERLVEAGVSSLPVLDAEGSLVGIVTEADLVSKEAYPDRRPRALAILADLLSGREHPWVTKAGGYVAGDVMTTNVATCGPNDDVRSVARHMLHRGVKRMPVVDDGALVGIVTRRDILRTFTRADDDIAAELRRMLVSHPPEDHHIESSVRDGIVTLTGDVRYPRDEPIMVAWVRSVDGVVDVVSRLCPREPDPPTTASSWTFGVR
jgi:CBS domain-containing protein